MGYKLIAIIIAFGLAHGSMASANSCEQTASLLPGPEYAGEILDDLVSAEETNSPANQPEPFKPYRLRILNKIFVNWLPEIAVESGLLDWLRPGTNNEQENELLKTYPFESVFIRQAGMKSIKVTKQIWGRSLHNGDESDATRHIVFMYLAGRNVGLEKALMFGIAHEDLRNLDVSNARDYNLAAMDVYNNYVGAVLSTNRGCTLDLLKQWVVKAIENEEVVVQLQL